MQNETAISFCRVDFKSMDDTNLQIVCESLNVTFGAVIPRIRNDAEREGPDCGELPQTLFSSGLLKEWTDMQLVLAGTHHDNTHPCLTSATSAHTGEKH